MIERSVVHGTVHLERDYSASPARVFAAWSDPEALLRWARPGEGWEVTLTQFDFRVGGSSVTRFGPGDGQVYTDESRYLDIVPDSRIVSAATLLVGDRLGFAGLLTIALAPSARGCRLKLTEQGAYLDGLDMPEGHEAGWGEMLERLDADLKAPGA